MPEIAHQIHDAVQALIVIAALLLGIWVTLMLKDE